MYVHGHTRRRKYGMKASFSEVKRMVTPCVHGACLDRDYINEQDLSKITTLLKPYCNVKVNIEKSKYDDGYLEFVIRVDALGVRDASI